MATTTTNGDCATIILQPKCYKDTRPRARIMKKNYICKKNRKKMQKEPKNAFFLIVIRFISQKYSTFAQNFKKRHKNTTKFLFNQIKLQNYENYRKPNHRRRQSKMPPLLRIMFKR